MQDSSSPHKDNFIRCSNCGKKLFKSKEGGGVIEILCRGCHKEVVVPFGEFFNDKNGKHKNK